MSYAVKRKLSASTDGKGIKIAATSTPGTLLHTAVAGTTAGTYDEIWLEAFNSDTVDRVLTIEFGDTTVPDHNIVVTIPHQAGLIMVVNGLILQNGATVNGFCPTANVLTVSGWVNSITD